MADIKFPKVKVRLVGEDGNAFMIIGRVRTSLKQAGVSREDIEAYSAAAMSGDYDNVLRVTSETVTIL